ncbi:unnamed protein product [Rotaria magnacalcarata]|uniref:Peroxin-7 n=3 Tax=Rotaria magnacalcarata TaxID=392030 RepID=A0A816SSP9_9BILA|nr:unnamed protein product [Rotaria magnacalcarata]CAF2146702.1 unnamed protein product [Rotaria magnacalcarata]CAF3903591.1 unnamed protein product [Rotaria magnacalcarata]CAF4000793.1 unnamed protein product [Rotaria magnacalcarata]
MLLRVNAETRLTDACYAIRYSPHVVNQLAIVSCENYGIRGRSTIQLISSHDQSVFNWSDAVFDVSFVETDPSLIVCGSGDGSLLVWQLNKTNSSPVLSLREHQREVWCVHWSESRSSDALLSTSGDGTIKLWNFDSSPMLQATLSGHESVVYEARWHPRRPGLIASVSADCSLRLFDIKQSSNVISPRAHPAEILSLDWSKYDDHLLVTGACDNRLRLWDIRMITNAVSVFDGHEAAVRRVKFDPHRRDRLASTGYDGQLKLWNLTPTNSNINMHTERFSKDFIYGLDWNLFERNKLVVGSWDRIVRFCEIVSM